MKTTIGTDIRKAKELLEKGETIAMPTETVYGLAANGLDQDALAKIFEAKNRPKFDPLILHIGKLEQIEELVLDVPEILKILAHEFWPGPLTFVLKKNSIVPELATAGMDTVGIRMPRHPMAVELLNLIDFPLAAPSANPFGYVSPTSANHVYRQLKGRIPYILDGGTSIVGLESTILDLTEAQPKILRKGGIPVENIERVVGRLEITEESSSNPKAPGMLVSHYAPLKPLILGNIKNLLADYEDKEIRVLGFKSTYGQKGYVLSESGDLTEAAQNFFAFLHLLDSEEAEVIIAEEVPNKGLGKAINDRLKRAAAN